MVAAIIARGEVSGSSWPPGFRLLVFWDFGRGIPGTKQENEAQSKPSIGARSKDNNISSDA